MLKISIKISCFFLILCKSRQVVVISWLLFHFILKKLHSFYTEILTGKVEYCELSLMCKKHKNYILYCYFNFRKSKIATLFLTFFCHYIVQNNHFFNWNRGIVLQIFATLLCIVYFDKHHFKSQNLPIQPPIQFCLHYLYGICLPSSTTRTLQK